MTKVKNVIEKVEAPTESQVISFLKDFKNVLPNNRDGEWKFHGVENNGKEFSYGVRHWGTWSASDDDDDERELSSKSEKIVYGAWKKYTDNCPFKSFVKRFDIEVGEKNWIDFSITLN